MEVLPADLHLLAHQLLVKGRCARLAAHAVEILHSVGDASGDAPLRRGSRHGGELLGGEGGLLLHLNGVGVRRAQLVPSWPKLRFTCCGSAASVGSCLRRRSVISSVRISLIPGPGELDSGLLEVASLAMT